MGQKLKAFSQGEEIKDPTTGLVLGREENELGVVKIASFFGENGSIANTLGGSLPKKDDLCRMLE